MAHEESDGSDSDYEELPIPSSPPQKPPNLVTFYIDNNQGSDHSDQQLRTEFIENMGKAEKQKWKAKHKKAKKRYAKLLKLFLDANPGFDEEQIMQQTRSPNRKSRKRSHSSSYAHHSGRAQYVGINTYDDEDMDYADNNRRKRRKSDPNNASTIDDLFREISSGTKRVQRDPDKFKLGAEDKVQMTNLVTRMRDEARKDWLCNKEQKPAINTSLMLDVVVSELSKKLFYKYYLDDTDILEALRDWIHPLPDGSLPALKIRTECYRIIEKFRLHEVEQSALRDYLSVESTEENVYARDVHPTVKPFAKTCMNLWAHPKETFANKQLLRKIMEKWIRTLTGSDSSYQDLRDEMTESQEVIHERYKMLQKQKRQFNFGEQKRAKIPEKPWHDFAKIPADKNLFGDDSLNIQRGIGGAHPLQERLNQTFKRSTTSKQAARPSVTGRKQR